MKRKDSPGVPQQRPDCPPTANKRQRSDDEEGTPARPKPASAPEPDPPVTAHPVASLHHTPLTSVSPLPHANHSSGHQPALPHLAPTDAHTAIDFLTARCVGLVRVPAAPTSSQHTGSASGSNTHQTRPAAPWPLARAALESMPLRPSLERQVSSLVDVLEGVVRLGSSSTALVMGPKACGKSLLVERAVARVCAAHNENPQGDKAVGVVRLSGLLHLEDRVAFSEAARQLCSEFDQPFSRTATYEENLLFFRTMLISLHASMKKVFFIIDGFERFAKQRGKQTLLYNLLDELQRSNVEAGVIGITTAQDIMAIMEKRVQSRFLHRRIIVSSPLHFEVPDPAAPAAAGPSRRSTASDSNPKPPVQYGDTPLGMLEDMLCLPSIARQHSQEEASEVRRSGWDEVARASGGGRGGGSHAAEGGRGGAGASRAAAGWRQAGNIGRPGGRIAAGAGGSEAAAGGQAAGGMARSGGGGKGRDEERLQLSEACVAALPVWRSPDFVARHNQAVKSCVQDEEVKAVLLYMFSTQLTSSKLSTIARMALAEWDRELRQQQRLQRQQQQRTGGGDTAALGTEQQQRLHQQQQQRTGDWESAALGREQQQQQQREQQRHDLPVQQGSALQHPQPQQQPPSQPAALQHALPQPSPTANARKRLRTAPEPAQQPDEEPQPPLGPQPDHQPQDRGNGSSPVLLLQPWHVVAACKPLRAADSMVRLVCDLSVFQLYLLAGMVRLSAKKHAMYNFEMVWDECKSKQDSSGILRSYKESEKAAWRAFEALMDTGIAFYSDPAAEAKGRNMKYAGAVLRLTGTEVEEGLAAHGSCPDEIMRFIRMET